MKSLPVIVFVFLILFCHISFGENIDLIVMVDISASMDPYFDEVVSYFLNDLLANNINIGDNFYFLIFSSSSEYYGELKIDDTPESIETVINKIKLIKPIALHTDLVEAVQSLYDFCIKLNQENSKLILLLTDGIHDPPENSKYNLDSREITQIMRRLGNDMKKDNWVFKIIRFPSNESNNASDQSISADNNEIDYLDLLADTSDSKIIEYNNDDKDTLTDSLNIIESEIPTLRNNENKDINQEKNEQGISFDFSKIIMEISLSPVLLIIIIGAAIIIIALYLIIHKMRMKSTVSKVIKKTAYKKKKKGRSEEIEMRVHTQNPKIGFRNIHQISKNKYKSVGGRNSAFLIFFIKFPSHIAELHWDGKFFTFKPVKNEYFPEIKGDIKNCLNKDIPAMSKKGYRIIINFFIYISPLEKINSIFNKVLSNYN